MLQVKWIHSEGVHQVISVTNPAKYQQDKPYLMLTYQKGYQFLYGKKTNCERLKRGFCTAKEGILNSQKELFVWTKRECLMAEDRFLN